MKIGIIGAGVVGFNTGEVLKRKHEVFYYDTDHRKGHHTSSHLEKIAKEAEVVFVCVPTPMRPSGEVYYNPIHDSLESLQYAVLGLGRQSKDLVVAIRSTAVSGTTDNLTSKYPFQFAFNPEFLTEKNARQDMENTNRIIVGAQKNGVHEKLFALYKEVFPNARYFSVDLKTAEMIKYFANVMLTCQVGLANELFGVSESLGFPYGEIKNKMLEFPGIGKNLQVPGPDGQFGFGGKCFPKDLAALIYKAREQGYVPYLLEEIWRFNLEVRDHYDWYDIPGATSLHGLVGRNIEKRELLRLPRPEPLVDLDYMVHLSAQSLLGGQKVIGYELSNICKFAGVDYEEVRDIVLLDERVGRNIEGLAPEELQLNVNEIASLQQLVRYADERNYEPHVLREVLRINLAVNAA